MLIRNLIVLGVVSSLGLSGSVAKADPYWVFPKMLSENADGFSGNATTLTPLEVPINLAQNESARIEISGTSPTLQIRTYDGQIYDISSNEVTGAGASNKFQKFITQHGLLQPGRAQSALISSQGGTQTYSGYLRRAQYAHFNEGGDTAAHAQNLGWNQWTWGSLGPNNAEQYFKVKVPAGAILPGNTVPYWSYRSRYDDPNGTPPEFNVSFSTLATDAQGTTYLAKVAADFGNYDLIQWGFFVGNNAVPPPCEGGCPVDSSPAPEYGAQSGDPVDMSSGRESYVPNPI